MAIFENATFSLFGSEEFVMKNTYKGRRISIKWKILIPVLIVNIVVCSTLGIVLGNRMNSTTADLAAQQALVAARVTANAVNAEEIVSLRAGDESSDTYLRAVASLDAVRQRVGALYVYTLYTDGINVYYGVEAAMEEPIGSLFEETYESLSDAFSGNEILDPTIYHTDDGVLISCYVPIFDSEGNVVSIMGCDYDAQEISNKTYTNITVVIACTLIGVIFTSIASVLVISRVLRPLQDASRIAIHISSCNLDAADDITCSNDEIGGLVEAFVAVAESLKEIITDIRYQLGEMRDGNYCVESRCPDHFIGDYAEILSAMTGIREGLNDALNQIGLAVSQVNDGTIQIAEGAQKLSIDTSEQTSSVAAISDAIRHIADAINDTARDAGEAVAMSRESGVNVEECNRSMQEFAAAMQEIDDKSKQISAIIQTIDSIAFQTNILALNAAVEAARAGEAGKGFSVVADEVRMLAQKSAAAAADTGDLIEGTTTAIKHSLELAHRTEEALKKVASSAVRTEDLIREISDACNREAEATEHINDSISHITDVVHANSALSEETAATCQELSAQTQSMDMLMKRYKLKV